MPLGKSRTFVPSIWPWLAIYGGFLLLNLLTLVRYPIAWMDEVMFADPAVNLAQRGAFASGVWHFQPTEAFFSVYQPLYSGLMAAWLKLWGVGMFQVRSLNLLLVLLAVSLIQYSLRAYGWVRQVHLRQWLAILLMTAFGLVFAYRSARVDWLMILLCAAIVAVFSLPSAGWRRIGLGGLAALLPFTGLQVVVFAGLTGLLALPFLRHRQSLWVDYAALLLGGLIGVGGLLALYHQQGTLSVMLEMYGWVSAQGAAHPGFSHQNHLPKDPSLLLLGGLALALALGYRRQRLVPLLRWSLLCSIAVPAALLFLGKFPTYYAWMVVIPLLLGIFAQWDACAWSRPWRVGLWGTTFVCAGLGLPFFLLVTVGDWQARDPRPLQAYVHTHLPAGAVVMADYRAYYPVQQRAAQVYAWRHLEAMSPAEKAVVTHLAIQPSQYAYVAEKMGGRWQVVAEPLRPARPPALQRWLGIPWDVAALAQLYNLAVYQRTGP